MTIEAKVEAKQTKNTGLIIGRVSENGLSITDDGKYINGKDNKQYKCSKVAGEIAIEIPTGVIKLRVNVNEKSKDVSPEGDGSKENKIYQAWVTVANEYKDKVDEAKGNGEADIIKMQCQLDRQDYYSTQKKQMVGFQGLRPQFSPSRENSLTEDDFQAEITIGGYIYTIKPEVITKGEESEETGRLIVTLITVNFAEKAVPIDLIVPAELADDFENTYNVGETVELDAEVIVRHVGGQPKSRAFGRSANTNTGYDVTEYVVIGGSETIEEDMEGYLDSEAIKKLWNERKIELEKIKKEGEEGKNFENSAKGVKKPVQNSPFGSSKVSSKANSISVSHEPLPF